MQPFDNNVRLRYIEGVTVLLSIKTSIIEKIAVAAITIDLLVLTILCYSYYLKF